MTTFSSIEEAFDWWIKNVYPTLPPESKKGRLTTAWRNYVHKESLSIGKMSEILKDHGFKIQTKVTYDP